MTDPAVPTLAVCVNAYGPRAMAGWVMAQMEDLNRNAGGNDKARAEELQTAAEAIVNNYPQLRLTDVMLFFSRFKAGLYGRFYGKSDTLVVTTALAKYVEERAADLRRIAQEQRHADMLYSRLLTFGRADLTLAELRHTPIWARLTDAQRATFARLNAERDRRRDWVRYNFSFVLMRRHRPDGSETSYIALNPAIHAQDDKLLFPTAKTA